MMKGLGVWGEKGLVNLCTQALDSSKGLGIAGV